MLSIIMAGGEGERLRPLTSTCPKPMLPLLDQPVLAYSLMLLKKHGVERAAITLRHLSDQIIDHFGDGGEHDIELTYFAETRPLGTAGGVKQAASFLTETFCVLSGDGVTDADLTGALEFHKQKRALVTMLIKRAPNPLEYGLVVTDADGRVTAFVEKPTWGGVVTDTINTGIYIMEPEALDYIPDARPFDFGKELFPLLLREGKALYGYVTDAYWCDIGDLDAYMRAHRDALDGRISLIQMPERGIYRMPGALIADSCELEAPAFIGRGARVKSGARVMAYSVLGEGATVGEYSSVKRSVLYPGAYAGAHSELRGCVLARGARLGERAAVYEGGVVGEHTILGARAEVKNGVKVWPGKRVPAGCVLSGNLVWGQRAERAFDGGLLITRTPEEAARAARALAWKLRLGVALVGSSASAVAGALAKAVCAGLTAQGARVYTAGECAITQLRHAMACVRADACMYVSTDGILVTGGDMSPLPPGSKRALDAAILRQDMPQPFTGIIHPPESLGRTDLGYLSLLSDALAGAVRRARVALHTHLKQLSYFADKAFSQAGFTARVEWEDDMMDLAPDEVGVWLTDEGERARFSDDGGDIGDVCAQLLWAWALAQRGETTIFAPPGATRALDDMKKRLGVNIEYAPESDHDYARKLFKASPHQYHMRFDGLYAALNIISTLGEKGLTLADFRAQAPDVKQATRVVPVDFDKRGGTLRKFSQSLPDSFERDGLFVRDKKGCAWIRPDDEKPLVTITAESLNAEYADEICASIAELIEKAKEP